MAVPDRLLQLVDTFERNLSVYKSGGYNETQARVEFIDPLFELLGWDVHNRAGHAEAYKDVVHEDAIKIGGVTKAPDYCFRIGGTRKFFLEAKKPSVSVRDDPSPAYQLRRYAWSAKLPLSILTDFEELAVFDTRVKPERQDKPSVARIRYLTFDQYPERWGELFSLFSKDAVLKGAFDHFAEETKAKRGTTEVDAAFLKEIERWRDLLARNIALRNPALTQRELNTAVQRTIDRLIFLRICEDRGIESQYPLRALLNGVNTYARLFELFQRADERYNSGLFHFQREKGFVEGPDTLTPGLAIDDKALKDIIGNLYYPDSPYEFSVLPADILGQVYEQFLGKVIRLTAGHRAVVDDKPEVKKAGGVYYTPTYIVDYIVKNTVGTLLGGRTPKQAAELRILDPACGSGSFLIGAYQLLLDWHRDWYVNHDPEKHARPRRGGQPELYQAHGGEWRLTTAERKRILLDSIFGVDIDPQAVEVTKLSLLLKVLEGESDQSVNTQLKLFHERALPDLGRNIKCGNSLIGPDYWHGRQRDLFDEEEVLRVNAFDWPKEFPEVLTRPNPGFDAVIGNPPYVFTRELMSDAERSYYRCTFPSSFEKQNTFLLFMELMTRLLAPSGLGSLIVPNSWLTIESAKRVRELLVPQLRIVADLNYLVFRGVALEPSVFVLAGGHTEPPSVSVMRASCKEEFQTSVPVPHGRKGWLEPPCRIVFGASQAESTWLDRLVERTQTIGSLFEVWSGLQAYERGRGTPPQTARDVKEHVFDRDHKSDPSTFPYLEGRDVRRFGIEWSGGWMCWGPWLAQPRPFAIFSRPRVLVREITSAPPRCMEASFADTVMLNNKSILNIIEPTNSHVRLKLLVAVLNSTFMSAYYKARAVKATRRVFPKIVIRNVREFPFPDDVLEDTAKSVVSLVDRMQGLQRQLLATKTDHERVALRRQLEATDREIDQLVYELYGLTDEEIRIVEEAIR